MTTLEQYILKAVAHILRIVADAIDVELNPPDVPAAPTPPDNSTALGG